jgi:hypothetical protein
MHIVFDLLFDSFEENMMKFYRKLALYRLLLNMSYYKLKFYSSLLITFKNIIWEIA